MDGRAGQVAGDLTGDDEPLADGGDIDVERDRP
jgi:hypothetical protein